MKVFKSKEQRKEFFIRTFALFVIYLFMVSGINVDVKAENIPTNPSDGVKTGNDQQTSWNDMSPTQKFNENPSKAWGEVYSGNMKVSEVPASAWPNADQSQIPSDQIKDIPVEHLNRAALKSAQLAYGDNLEFVGDLGQCNGKEVTAAIKSKYGVTVTVTSGVMIKKGKIYHPNYFKSGKGINLNTINKQLTLSAVEATDPKFSKSLLGFVICSSKGCAVVASEGANIDGLQFEDGNVQTLIGNKKVGVNGQINVFRDKNGNMYMVVNDGSSVFIGDLEITAYGSDNHGNARISTIQNKINIDGPATIKGPNIEGTNQVGKLTLTLDNKGTISNIDSQGNADLILTKTLLDNKQAKTRLVGSFNTKIVDSRVVEYARRSENSYLKVGETIIDSLDIGTPVILQYGDGKLIGEGNDHIAALALRRGYNSALKAADDGKREFWVETKESNEIKKELITCANTNDCKTKLKTAYKIDSFDNYFKVKDSKLIVAFTEDHNMRDFAGIGKFRIKDPELGTFNAQDPNDVLGLTYSKGSHGVYPDYKDKTKKTNIVVDLPVLESKR
jgi:hypothetical protein